MQERTNILDDSGSGSATVGQLEIFILTSPAKTG